MFFGKPDTFLLVEALAKFLTIRLKHMAEIRHFAFPYSGTFMDVI